jgi:hypothetical protein
MSELARVIRHYGVEDLRERLAAGLRAAGLADKTLLSPKDPVPLDQFHTRGLVATVELTKSVGIKRDSEVLDIGSVASSLTQSCLNRSLPCKAISIRSLPWYSFVTSTI